MINKKTWKKLNNAFLDGVEEAEEKIGRKSKIIFPDATEEWILADGSKVLLHIRKGETSPKWFIKFENAASRIGLQWVFVRFL